MRRLFAVTLLVLLADAGAVGMLADGQQDYRPPAGPTPRTPSGKVDFSGVWEKPYVPDMTKDGKGQKGHPATFRSRRGAKPSGRSTTRPTATTPAPACRSA